MNNLSYTELKEMPAEEQVTIVNKLIESTSKNEAAAQLGIKSNTLNKHMGDLGYRSSKGSGGQYFKDDNANTRGDDGINKDYIGIDKNDYTNNKNDVSSNKVNKGKNKNDIITSNEKLVKDREGMTKNKYGELWSELDRKKLMTAKSDVFRMLLEELDEVDMDANPAKTSLSLYVEAAETLDLMAKTFKQSKQDIVSAAILHFADTINNKIK